MGASTWGLRCYWRMYHSSVTKLARRGYFFALYYLYYTDFSLISYLLCSLCFFCLHGVDIWVSVHIAHIYIHHYMLLHTFRNNYKYFDIFREHDERLKNKFKEGWMPRDGIWIEKERERERHERERCAWREQGLAMWRSPSTTCLRWKLHFS